MKYCIQEFKKHGKTAGTKAVRDVIQILTTNGYCAISIIRRIALLYAVKLLLKLKHDDEVLFQWPQYNCLTHFLVKILINKGVKLSVLIHDINSLRNLKIDQDAEDLLFKKSDRIIVHTHSMKQYLENRGISPQKIYVLTSFDYLSPDEFRYRDYSNIVVFAGNLNKSSFINTIPSDCFGIKLNFYGLYTGVFPSHLTYKGSFFPENVSIIEGSWGLVWDGDSISTCSGDVGNYMKVNSPHKVSMYIVSGLPIIIWKYAGLSEYIVKNNLGITIESLDEISQLINSVSEEQYSKMILSIENEAKALKAGKHLMSLLQ